MMFFVYHCWNLWFGYLKIWNTVLFFMFCLKNQITLISLGIVSNSDIRGLVLKIFKFDLKYARITFCCVYLRRRPPKDLNFMLDLFDFKWKSPQPIIVLTVWCRIATLHDLSWVVWTLSQTTSPVYLL